MGLCLRSSLPLGGPLLHLWMSLCLFLSASPPVSGSVSPSLYPFSLSPFASIPQSLELSVPVDLSASNSVVLGISLPFLFLSVSFLYFCLSLCILRPFSGTLTPSSSHSKFWCTPELSPGLRSCSGVGGGSKVATWGRWTLRDAVTPASPLESHPTAPEVAPTPPSDFRNSWLGGGFPPPLPPFQDLARSPLTPSCLHFTPPTPCLNWTSHHLQQG